MGHDQARCDHPRVMRLPAGIDRPCCRACSSSGESERWLLGLIALLAGLTQVPSGNARVVGIVVGVVGGFGIGLLLQQMAILDPANVLGLLLPGGGAVLGAILPGLLHSRRTARP